MKKQSIAKLAGLAGLSMVFSGAIAQESVKDAAGEEVVLKAGHPSLKKWLLPDEIPSPADNKMTPERVKLGKALFFDPRLSAGGQTTCVSCHLPERGWSDGFPKSVKMMGGTMPRNSPTIVNLAYGSLFMWDGRQPSLEKQPIPVIDRPGPMNAGAHKDAPLGPDVIKNIAGYQKAFAEAYPNEPINIVTISKALASFERSVVSKDAPFDRWVKGDEKAMTPAQVRGFALFVSPDKGNCLVCHSGANFSDNGFHNIGLKSFGDAEPDVGRFKQKPIAALKGAFKTPTLRDVTLTAPYFHDGSVASLAGVVDHYARGGEVKTNISPNMKTLNLSDQEKADLVSFMEALTTKHPVFQPPVLPE